MTPHDRPRDRQPLERPTPGRRPRGRLSHARRTGARGWLRAACTGLLAAAGVATSVTAALPDAVAKTSPAERARKRALRRTPVVEAVEKAAPAVVSIGTTQLVRVRRFWEWDFLVEERPGALGSGVIVHPRGYVVTNAHVINQAAQIAVKLTGLGEETEIPAELIAVDLEHDLALLRMEKPGPYPAADFGDTSDLMVGETVVAMGSPFGLGRTVTTGVVSALRRDIRIRDQMFEGMVQTDAPVNQGNSGGALLNILGEWIGVNSAIYSRSGGSDGISFAIPIETVREFLVEAMRPRRIAKRWLGLEFGERADGAVEIARVYPVGPAAEKGLRPGMQVFDRRGIPETDLVDLTFRVLDAAAGDDFELRILTPEGSRPVTLRYEAPPTDRLTWQRLGVRVAEITSDVRERTGLPEGSGLLVSAVREGGPAERVGIRQGDVLVEVGSTRVRSLDRVMVDLQGTPAARLVDIKLVRPHRSRRGIQFEPWKARVETE